MKKLVVFGCAMALCCAATAGGYRTTVGEGDDAIALVVVYGTPYEMGLAFGSLMKEESIVCQKGYMKAAEDTHMGRFQAASLDKTWETIAPFTDKRFIEEIDGIAAGTGLPVEEVRRPLMLPVVADYACSGVAAWGKATVNGDLYQFRNLDYTTDAGLQDYPTVVIYIPNEGVPHVLPTFAGCPAANTGMNKEGIILGEKGETPWTDYPYIINGPHFMSLFRTILYDAHSLDEALNIIQTTPRIKRYYWYFGDGKIPEAVKIKTFMPVDPELKIWRGGDPADELAPNVLPNTIYQTMKNGKAFEYLSANMGKLDAEHMIELSRAVASGGGNLLDVVYNATQLELWVAYAEKSEPASSRPYVHIKMKDYLDVNKVPKGAKVFTGK